MAAEYLLELYYSVGVLLEFKPESCEERTGGISRWSVGKCGDLDLYAGGTNYIWNSDISGKCHAPAGVVEAVARTHPIGTGVPWKCSVVLSCKRC